MSVNGQLLNGSANGPVLTWSGRVLAVDDLRRSLNGHREIVVSPRTVVTPLAAEQLRADGVRVSRLPTSGDRPKATGKAVGYAQERPQPVIESAVRALERDGVPLRPLPASEDPVWRWAKAVAECVARDECGGGVIFCHDPGLVCCVANKVTGLRAAAVCTVAQAARATLTLGANLLAVEMPGRTFFEIRQILRTLCDCGDLVCPPGVACTLSELEGADAHR